MQSAVPSDAILVGRTREGERAAFDLLVERHYGVVFAIALARLKDPDVAEDLAQEVFLRLFLQLASLRDPHQFGAWAARVARNLAIDWQRRGRRTSMLLPLVHAGEKDRGLQMHEPADPSRGVREQMQQSDDLRVLHQELNKLPAEEREMVLLHYLEHLPKREIAERLGVHPSTVGRTIERALSAMRSGFEESLKGALVPLAPRQSAVAKTTATITAVALLPAAARAELVAAVAAKEGAGIVAGMAQAVCAPPAKGFLASLAAKAATGVLVMGSGKVAGMLGAAVVAGVVLIAVNSPALRNTSMPLVAAPSGSVQPVSTSLPPGWTLSVENTRETKSVAQGPDNNVFTGQGVDLGTVISQAWHVTPGRVETSVDLSTPHKNFRLSAPKDVPEDVFVRVLQNEIQKAWNVRITKETQNRDVIILKAPAGKPAAFMPTNGVGARFMKSDGGKVTVNNAGLRYLVQMLEVERWKPVVDETGLNGTYNYAWSGNTSTAAEQQLGLTLEEGRRDVEVVIVHSTQVEGQ